jgi:mannitol/fructose-specific phosphotransferase system IIA component (Ntr-type)
MQKENCKQIRIFYNKYDDGNDNYRETLMNISRVFDDKEVMRSKIISKQKDDYIRQFNKQE